MSDHFQTSLVLARVLTSGVIMSIERNETELPSLARTIVRASGYRHVALFNSVSGARHAALWGQGLVEGDRARLLDPDERECRLAAWLGLDIDRVGEAPSYQSLSIGWMEAPRFGAVVRSARLAPVLTIDFTPLGFGPCAAVATDDVLVWNRAERLKIFGAFDLRTMWTQEEAAPELEPAVQFNYRLSPLVAACVNAALHSGGSDED